MPRFQIESVACFAMVNSCLTFDKEVILAGNEERKKIAVKGGIYTISENDEAAYLIGSQCKKCGTKFYPQRKICAHCYGNDLEEIALSKRGKIWSFTDAQQTYPGVLLKAPFIVGLVELPEKVYVMTQLTGIDPKDLKIGLGVEFYEYKIAEDAEREIIAFAFRPVSN